MATIIALKRRILAAQNVSKTTRAMQMISASKLKKAQDAALSTRPYVEKLQEMTKSVTARVDTASYSHRYIEQKNLTAKSLLIVLAPDKGLCGSLVSNLIKEFIRFYNQNKKNAYYIAVGKKIQSPVARITNDVTAAFNFGTTTPTFDMVYPILRIVDDYYLNRKVDSVYVLYTHFTSFFSQTPRVEQLLPILLHSEGNKEASTNFLFEPSIANILSVLLRHDLEMSLYHYLVESFVSEQASRMLAMQNATTNAKDIIEDLRLEYNKTRQSKITSELLDITGSGASNRV